MINRKIYGLFLLTVLFLSIGSTATPDQGIAAGNKNGVVTLQTDGLVIEIVGNSNIPSFFFWAPGNDTDTYKLSFDQVFEVTDSNANGIYDLGNDSVVPNTYAALAAFNWDFSEFALTSDENNVTTAVDFNITSIADALYTQSGKPSSSFEIQFRIHMNIANSNELKFDVVLNNYTFASDDAMLVLSYKLITAQKDQIQVKTQAHSNTSELKFGNAYFQSNSTAESDNSTTLGVGLSHGDEEGSNKIYMAYEHFNKSFVHDPTIGIKSTDSSANSTTDQNTGENSAKNIANFVLPELSKEALFATSAFATLVFVAIPVAIRKMKK